MECTGNENKSYWCTGSVGYFCSAASKSAEVTLYRYLAKKYSRNYDVGTVTSLQHNELLLSIKNGKKLNTVLSCKDLVQLLVNDSH